LTQFDYEMMKVDRSVHYKMYSLQLYLIMFVKQARFSVILFISYIHSLNAVSVSAKNVDDFIIMS